MVQTSTSRSNTNGHALTLQALADAKRLPVEFVRDELGLRDLPTGGVGIPYLGPTGEQILVKQRTAIKAKEGSYWPKGHRLTAYGQNRLDAAAKAGFLIPVEGESDCWALWYHRLPALGIPGANAAVTLKREHIEAVETVYVHREPDDAGALFVAGVCKRLTALDFKGKVFELRMPDGIKDPADLHADAPEQFKARLEQAIRDSTPLDLPAPEEKPKPADAKKRKRDKGNRRAKSQADELVSLASAAELFHNADGDGFASVAVGPHRETHRLKSKGFRRWLSRQFHAAKKKAPTAGAMQDALAVLEGQAQFDNPELPVAVRVAAHGESIFLDLADPDWQAVEVTSTGWRVTARPPVKFIRPRGLLALPQPVTGGTVDELRQYVNVGSDNDWRLLVAGLVASLRPRGPYPVLALHGEQGSGKSNTARMLRALVDPNTASLRAQPRDLGDLIIAATNSWIVSLDNLSYLKPWFSDALCRLSTGGGFAKRELYSDADEIIFDVVRPVVLNGIEELATRSDLLDRSLVLYLPNIPEAKCRPEERLWTDFYQARPRILGALLDAAAGALCQLPRVKLTRAPRMADFAHWIVASEPALGWPPRAFMAAYSANRGNANDLALESSPIVPPLRDLAAGMSWSGTCQELLDKLATLADEKATRAQYWPKSARSLSAILRRLAPNLRRAGVSVEIGNREPGGKRARIVTIQNIDAILRPDRPDRPESEKDQPFDGTQTGTQTADGTQTGTDAGRKPETDRPDANPNENVLWDSDRDAGDDGDANLRPLSACEEWGEV
jgi:hypothetical protein